MKINDEVNYILLCKRAFSDISAGAASKIFLRGQAPDPNFRVQRLRNRVSWHTLFNSLAEIYKIIILQLSTGLLHLCPPAPLLFSCLWAWYNIAVFILKKFACFHGVGCAGSLSGSQGVQPEKAWETLTYIIEDRYMWRHNSILLYLANSFSLLFKCSQLQCPVCNTC